MKIAKIEMHCRSFMVNLTIPRRSPVVITSRNPEVLETIYTGFQITAAGQTSTANVEIVQNILNAKLAVISEESDGDTDYKLDAYTHTPIRPAFSNVADRVNDPHFREVLAENVPFGPEHDFRTIEQVQEAVGMLSDRVIGQELVSLLHPGQCQALNFAVRITDWILNHAPFMLIWLNDFSAFSKGTQDDFLQKLFKNAPDRQAFLLGDSVVCGYWVSEHFQKCALIKIQSQIPANGRMDDSEKR
jgi:hypothetical protein